MWKHVKKMDRNLRSINKDSIESQFRIFLKRLQNKTKDKTSETIEESDPKELIKQFMKKEELYSRIELIMQATAVSAVKMSIESLAESFI